MKNTKMKNTKMKKIKLNRKKIIKKGLTGLICLAGLAILPNCTTQKVENKTYNEQVIQGEGRLTFLERINLEIHKPVYNLEEVINKHELAPITLTKVDKNDLTKIYGVKNHWNMAVINTQKNKIHYKLTKHHLYRERKKLIKNLPKIRENLEEKLTLNLKNTHEKLIEQVQLINDKIATEKKKFEKRKEITLDKIKACENGEYVIVKGKPMNFDIKELVKGKALYQGEGIFIGKMDLLRNILGIIREKGTIDINCEVKKDIGEGYMIVLADEKKNYVIAKDFDTTNIMNDYLNVFKKQNKIKDFKEATKMIDEIRQKYTIYTNERNIVIENGNNRFLLEKPGVFFNIAYQHRAIALDALNLVHKNYGEICKQVNNNLNIKNFEELKKKIRKIKGYIKEEGLNKLQTEYYIDKNFPIEKRRLYQFIGKKTTIKGLPAIELMHYEIINKNNKNIKVQITNPY